MLASTRTVAIAVALACTALTPAMPAIPPHLVHVPELYARSGRDIVAAPEQDQAVARQYPTSSLRGALTDGLRMTILTARARYAVGEEVRVVHVVETAAGQEAYVMGPKPIYGEVVDGAGVTPGPETAEYPWVGVYDGAVLAGPAADYNFEVTTYRFDAPGLHRIEWRIGKRRSNTLVIDVR
jgi:hypothetical protein